MVIGKIAQSFQKNDEKYEFLLHKYSSLRLENKKLHEKNQAQKREIEFKKGNDFANELMNLYEKYERAKEQSFKVQATNLELQRFLLEFNTIGKELDKSMKKHSIELYEAKERFFDIDLHEIGAYQEAKGMKKGIILKTTRKGCKFKNKIIKKPRVVVTQ